MPKKTYSAIEAHLLNRSHKIYRQAILSQFRRIYHFKLVDHLTKPEDIVEEFAHILSEDISTVYDRFYKRLENLLGGSDAVLKKNDLFELIEKIVWDYCEDEVLGITLEIKLHHIARSYCRFLDLHKSNNRLESVFKENQLSVYEKKTYFSYLEDDAIYKVQFTNRRHNHQFENDQFTPIRAGELCDTYFSFINSGNNNYDFVLSINSLDNKNFYCGFNIINKNVVHLISLEQDAGSALHFYDSNRLDPAEDMINDKI